MRRIEIEKRINNTAVEVMGKATREVIGVGGSKEQTSNKRKESLRSNEHHKSKKQMIKSILDIGSLSEIDGAFLQQNELSAGTIVKRRAVESIKEGISTK